MAAPVTFEPPPAGDPEADGLLLQRVRDGDPAALDELLQRAQRIAWRYSQAVCGRAPDSEDAMQEALLRTFRHVGRLREPRAFRAWLYRTVKNACLIGRRRRVGAPARFESLDNGDGSEQARAVPSADQGIFSREARADLHNALAEMPPTYREAVFLRDLEGLSTRETARVLGISEANVKVRLHRAHEYLRRQLQSP